MGLLHHVTCLRFVLHHYRGRFQRHELASGADQQPAHLVALGERGQVARHDVDGLELLAQLLSAE